MRSESRAAETARAALAGFADDVRACVSRLDPEIGAWLAQAVLAADTFGPTQHALRELDLADAYCVAVGKAAVPMALAWQAAGGAAGTAVVPVGASVPAILSEWQTIEGEHPLPGAGSLRAGESVLHHAQSGNDIVLLLSGGASAMMEAPTVPPMEHAALSRELRGLGLPIGTWNAARAMLSRIKSGGLAGAVREAGGQLHTLYASDVPGDDPAVVGSGPGTPRDPEALERAIAGLPERLRARLVEAAAARAEPAASTMTRCVLPRHAAAQRAARAIEEAGRQPLLLDPLDAPIDEAARRLEDAARSAHGPIVVWGEPLVSLPAEPGPGGRTTMLIASLWANGSMPGARVAIAGTDGVDGASGLGASYARLDGGREQDAQDALRDWQTAALLLRLDPATGGGVPARPTGANLADVGIIVPAR